MTTLSGAAEPHERSESPNSSSDLVLWLRSQLDADDFEVQRALLTLVHPESRRPWEEKARTVAAHRAILDDLLAEPHEFWDEIPTATCALERVDSWTGRAEPGDECTCGVAGRVERRIKLLASIYSERPGFDPSWRADAETS